MKKNYISLMALICAINISFNSICSADVSQVDSQVQTDEIHALLADLKCNRVIYDGKSLKIIKEPSWLFMGSALSLTGLAFGVSKIQQRDKNITMSQILKGMGVGLGLFSTYLVNMKLRKTSYILFDEQGVIVNDKRVCTWPEVSKAKVITMQQSGSINNYFFLLDKHGEELVCEMHNMLPVDFDFFVRLVKTFMLKKAKVKFY